MTTDRPDIRAAGGIVTRRSDDGGVEFLVVHRPKYDDWSWPKGKLEPGEQAEAAALREVEEETGYRCRLGPELAAVRYRDRNGRDKQVRFWNMTVTSLQGWEPNDEVDDRRWISPAVAATLLTYETDRRMLPSLEGAGSEEDPA